MKKQLTIEAQN